MQSCACAHSTRRNVLLGAGAVGATAVLAACGTTGGANANGTDFSNNPAPAGSAGAQATGAGPVGTAGPGGTAGPNAGDGGGSTPIAKTADVKVGSGIITTDYVITQPTAGQFKAFSKVCPHQGCDVNKVDGGVISCPCHGSQFSVKDGSVVTGPAAHGLTAKNVKVDGGNIVSA
ncbi:Rieske (2Fe-2S) protein [Actinoplanes sp. NPDC051411]|uniref:Rieske (2Fe-2S) protein n=1 Tax=Actinoplanes sp. NPDC051411 TaxID=3155522 RepID=UPI0034445873